MTWSAALRQAGWVALSRVRAELRKARGTLEYPWRRRRLESSLEVLRLRADAERRPDRCVVVTVVRDGQTWIEPWLEHYLELGADEIVVLDNGSIDRTVEVALAQPRATVLRSRLPFRAYNSVFKRFLVERFGEGRWCLLVDVDEFFDYPFSGELPFPRFLEYLNSRGYTAVMATMLDLFADGPSHTWPAGGRELLERCVWYDPSSLVPSRHWRLQLRNRFADRDMPFYRGGVMYQAFGVRAVATKFPLIYYRRGGRLDLRRHGHFCRGAHVADVSAVLLHYRCDRRLVERLREQFDRGPHFAALARKAGEAGTGGDLVLRRPSARRLEHVDQLVDDGLLRVSAAYREFVMRNRA